MTATVLLADDDRDLLRLTALALRTGGHAVTEAGDGIAALAAAVRVRPDLVVADVMMPGLTGLALADLLRGDGDQGPPVLLISGASCPAALHPRCAFLTKPFAIDRLLRAVDALLADATR